MNREQTIKLISQLQMNYPNFVEEDKVEKMVDYWATELSQYDYEDVMERFKQLLGDNRFQMKPPTLIYIISSLTPKHDKINYEKGVFFCPNCNRPFNLEPVMNKHWDRCRSVDYIIRETKKWFNKKISRKSLFDLSEEEFEKAYDRLLHYIYEHTQDKHEKTRIGYIFNPPSQEEARQFLGY